nr:MAG TPA: hypothetical protein [Caudoviricetes sp.]
MPLPIVSLILGKRYIRNRRLPFPLHFCFRAEICMCLTTWETAAVLVSYNCRNVKHIQL